MKIKRVISAVVAGVVCLGSVFAGTMFTNKSTGGAIASSVSIENGQTLFYSNGLINANLIGQLRWIAAATPSAVTRVGTVEHLSLDAIQIETRNGGITPVINLFEQQGIWNAGTSLDNNSQWYQNITHLDWQLTYITFQNDEPILTFYAKQPYRNYHFKSNSLRNNGQNNYNTSHDNWGGNIGPRFGLGGSEGADVRNRLTMDFENVLTNHFPSLQSFDVFKSPNYFHESNRWQENQNDTFGGSQYSRLTGERLDDKIWLPSCAEVRTRESSSATLWQISQEDLLFDRKGFENRMWVRSSQSGSPSVTVYNNVTAGGGWGGAGAHLGGSVRPAVHISLKAVEMAHSTFLLEQQVIDLEAELETLKQELATMTGNRDSLQTQLNTRTTERDDLQAQVGNLTTERDEYKTNFGIAEGERDQYREQKEYYQGYQQYQNKYNQVVLDRDGLQNKIDAKRETIEQRDETILGYETRNAELETERNDYQTRYNTVKEERDQYKATLDSIEFERDGYKTQLGVLSKERDNYKNQVDSCGVEIKKLTGIIVDKNYEIEKLNTAIAKINAELEKVKNTKHNKSVDPLVIVSIASAGFLLLLLALMTALNIKRRVSGK